MSYDFHVKVGRRLLRKYQTEPGRVLKWLAIKLAAAVGYQIEPFQ